MRLNQNFDKYSEFIMKRCLEALEVTDQDEHADDGIVSLEKFPCSKGKNLDGLLSKLYVSHRTCKDLRNKQITLEDNQQKLAARNQTLEQELSVLKSDHKHLLTYFQKLVDAPGELDMLAIAKSTADINRTCEDLREEIALRSNEIQTMKDEHSSALERAASVHKATENVYVAEISNIKNQLAAERAKLLLSIEERERQKAKISDLEAKVLSMASVQESANNVENLLRIEKNSKSICESNYKKLEKKLEKSEDSCEKLKQLYEDATKSDAAKLSKIIEDQGSLLRNVISKYSDYSNVLEGLQAHLPGLLNHDYKQIIVDHEQLISGFKCETKALISEGNRILNEMNKALQPHGACQCNDTVRSIESKLDLVINTLNYNTDVKGNTQSGISTEVAKCLTSFLGQDIFNLIKNRNEYTPHQLSALAEVSALIRSIAEQPS